MRAEYFADADCVFATIGELQAALDGWVDRYSTTSRFLELVDLLCDVAWTGDTGRFCNRSPGIPGS
jgi:hypothetical protein